MTARRSPFVARAFSSINVVLASAMLVAPSLVARPAFAQAAPGGAATPATPSAPSASPAPAPAPDPAAAKASLATADKAAKAKDWAGALAGYSAANAAQASAQAQEGIANAQYELKHAGEAYDAYDQFLKQYGTAIGTTRKKQAEARLKELAAHTGYVSIRVNESGALVSIDGNAIGTSPVAALIRVADGPHKIAVKKDGFAAVEKVPSVTANGKEIVEVNLVRESKLGHLVVKEKSGAQVRVVLDGNDVGAAPYETDLDPGTHEVLLRSSNMAAPAQKIEITKGKTSEVELVAVSATAHLEVNTSDRQGIIFLDGKPVAEGAFTGDVSVGPHAIAVTRDGFERFDKTVTLADKQSLVESVTMKRPALEAHALDTEGPHSFKGVYGGFGLGPMLQPGGNGNELETRCTQLGAVSCKQSMPIGPAFFAWAGYSWHPVGIEGFLAGSYDQSTPSATFDGTVKAGQNPLTASFPRVEQFSIIRVGGTAAVRVRVSFESERLRGSLAAGFGISLRKMLFERDAATSDGLKNAYVDKSQSYISPALSLDGSLAIRTGRVFAIALGVMSIIETAGQDVTSAPSGNQYIGGGGVAAPIPTPAYHLASSTQVMIVPYVGFQFGP